VKEVRSVIGRVEPILLAVSSGPGGVVELGRDQVVGFGADPDKQVGLVMDRDGVDGAI